MKKDFSYEGENGTITGEIKIQLNYTNKAVEINNHSTHDTDVKNISLHKITAFVDGAVWKTFDELRSEKDVEDKISELESDLKSRLKHLADCRPVKSLQDRLKENGYS